jgi:hypothetical protein
LKRLGGDYARFVEESDYELSQVIGMIIIKKHETDGSAWIDQNKAGFLKKPAFWICFFLRNPLSGWSLRATCSSTP